MQFYMCMLTHLSKDRPQAMTDTPSGKPMGSSISGRKTPEFPTSTHFFRPKRDSERQRVCDAKLGQTVRFPPIEGNRVRQLFIALVPEVFFLLKL